MSKNKFFQSATQLMIKDAIASIGDRVGLITDVANLPEKKISSIKGLITAGPDDVSFCIHGKYRDQLAKTKAGVLLVTAALQHDAPKDSLVIILESPQLAYTLIGAMFYPRVVATYHDIHPTAVISETAVIEKPVLVGPHVVIGDDVKIGKGSIIGANTVIDAGVEIGNDNRIADNCSISYCIMGNGCDIDSGVRIGGRGFGLVPTKDGIVRMPQLGQVVIGNDVGISCNSVIDRGTSSDTIIADNAQLDNVVVIGHNSEIDRSAVLCSLVGLGGSVKIGTGAMIGGQAGVSDHIVVGEGVKAAAQSGIMSDVEAGKIVGGTPSINLMQYLRSSYFIKTKMMQNRKKSNKK